MHNRPASPDDGFVRPFGVTQAEQRAIEERAIEERQIAERRIESLLLEADRLEFDDMLRNRQLAREFAAIIHVPGRMFS